jgi:hypothetical protein
LEAAVRTFRVETGLQLREDDFRYTKFLIRKYTYDFLEATAKILLANEPAHGLMIDAIQRGIDSLADLQNLIETAREMLACAVGTG